MFLEIKRGWYFMILFKHIWRGKQAGTWIAFNIRNIGKPFYFSFFFNGFAKQTFINLNLFPLFIQKNNSKLEIGLSLFKIYIGVNFHVGFFIKPTKKRKWIRNSTRFDIKFSKTAWINNLIWFVLMTGVYSAVIKIIY